jgi:hypothetical protein
VTWGNGLASDPAMSYTVVREQFFQLLSFVDFRFLFHETRPSFFVTSPRIPLPFKTIIRFSNLFIHTPRRLLLHIPQEG